MLNEQQAMALSKEILEKNKEVMKDILALARQGLDESRFNFFRKEVFNKFGVSGFQGALENILSKYMDKK